MMEKLLNLLNEYEEKEGYNKAEWEVSENNQLHYKHVVSDTPNGEGFSEKYLSRDVSQAYLISSRYRFIKWLFDKDKIDWSKFHKYSFYKKDNKFIQYYDCESLLIALSISDNPIDFLCEIIKN